MAERLVDEQSGVAIFALGVGRGVEKSELDRIIAVCGPDEGGLALHAPLHHRRGALVTRRAPAAGPPDSCSLPACVWQ